MAVRKKTPRRPDAQAALRALVELYANRAHLVTQANAAWQDGKRAKAKQLARKVVAIEVEIEALISSTRSRHLQPPI
jgi:hypothetical protein